MNREANNYLTILSELEYSWQTAVGSAMSVRENQLSAAHQIIVDLQQQVQQQESLVKLKEQEIEALHLTVTDLNNKLDSANAETSHILEQMQSQNTNKAVEHDLQLKAKDKDIEEIQFKHRNSIFELTAGTRNVLRELESQLEVVKTNEVHYQKKIQELEEVTSKQEKHLRDWNRASDQMCQELLDVKNNLRSSRNTNTKLREEIIVWKQCCQKLEEEQKTKHGERELEKNVLSKLNEIKSFFETERQHRRIIFDETNRIGVHILEELKTLNYVKQPVILTSVESQTEPLCEERKEVYEEKDKTIAHLRIREHHFEDEIRKFEIHMENLTQQNMTLREVIKAMKKEKENLGKEKEQLEEEARINKLEESMKVLKNNLIHEKNDVCIWNALQDIKKEISNIKNKNHKATQKEGENSQTLRNAAVVSGPFTKLS